MLSSIMCVVYICFVVLLFFAGFVFDLVDFRGSGGYFHFISYSRSTTTTTATTNSRKVFHSRVWDWKREKCHWPGTFPPLLSFLFIFHADHRSSLIPLINQLCVCVCDCVADRPVKSSIPSRVTHTHTYSHTRNRIHFNHFDEEIQSRLISNDNVLWMIYRICVTCALHFFSLCIIVRGNSSAALLWISNLF